MANSARSIYRRIRNVKSSLENAEQSFLDNNGMRGELDLMLAEAELKNLRRKKDVPWSWNRQMLAVCAAIMLVLAGFSGWYYAQESFAAGAAALTPKGKNYQSYMHKDTVLIEKSIKTAVNTTEQVEKNEKNDFPQNGETVINKTAKTQKTRQVTISGDDMRRLVHSARIELSNSK